eukprot:5075336-Heterocapsa_arctica.AAC.1
MCIRDSYYYYYCCCYYYYYYYCVKLRLHILTTYYFTGKIYVGCDAHPSRLHRPPLRLPRFLRNNSGGRLGCAKA